MTLPWRTLVGAATFPAYRRFAESLETPQAAQQKVWRDIHERLLRAPFWIGKAKRPSEHLLDYPLTTFSDYEPALREALRTGISPLSGDRVEFFAQSAGTTGASKLFPMTAAFRKQFQRTTAPFVHSLIRKYPTFLKAPVLYFAATAPETYVAERIPVGYISRYNYQSIPALLRKFYAFPDEVFQDSQTFADWGAYYALATDVSAMFAVTPLSYQSLCRTIRGNFASYLSMLKGGKFPGKLPAPRCSAARLAHLSSLSAEQLDFKHLWPGLCFVCCWKTSVCAVQLAQVAAALEGISVVDATYSATEGWINVPFADGRPGGAIHPGAHVFEFLPVGAAAEPTSLQALHTLETGQNYELVLTTAMGMVRYRLFDQVRCTGHLGATPVIEFVRKTAKMFSLGLAVIGEDELASASTAAGLELESSWRFSPNAQGNGLLLWIPPKVIPSDDKVAEADRQLQTMNVNYGKYRSTGTFAQIELRCIPEQHPLLQPTATSAQSKPTLLLEEPLCR